MTLNIRNCYMCRVNENNPCDFCWYVSTTKHGGKVYTLFLSFNSYVKFHSKICTHCWNIDKSHRGRLLFMFTLYRTVVNCIYTTSSNRMSTSLIQLGTPIAVLPFFNVSRACGRSRPLTNSDGHGNRLITQPLFSNDVTQIPPSH